MSAVVGSVRPAAHRLRGALGLVFLLGVLGAGMQALAHPTQMSRMTLTPTPGGVRGELQVDAFDLAHALDRPDLVDSAGHASATRLAHHHAALHELLARTIHLSAADGTRCVSAPVTVQTSAQFVMLQFAWTCPNRHGLVYESSLLQAVDAGARQIVVLAAADGPRQTLLDHTRPRWVLEEAPGVAATFGRYLLAGGEHILIGYDHLAFLVGVLAWARRLWPVVKAVTAFTVAHSLTLALAVLGIVGLPSAPVEIAIALTIVYIAVENCLVRELDRRWRVTGVLGLVHGLGFASVLREYGLPEDALAVALAAFNLGVELGQLAVVGGVFAMLLALDRILADRQGRTERRAPALALGVSAGVGAVGLLWTWQRVIEVL